MVSYLICPARHCPDDWMIELPSRGEGARWSDEGPTTYDLAAMEEWADREIDALVEHLESVVHDPPPVMALIVAEAEGPSTGAIAAFRAQAGDVVDVVARTAARLAGEGVPDGEPGTGRCAVITPWHRHYMLPVDVAALPVVPFGRPYTAVLRRCRCSHMDSLVLTGTWGLTQVQGWAELGPIREDGGPEPVPEDGTP